MSVGLSPLRGEIWQFVPPPALGHEQGGERPGVVVSADEMNRSGQRIVTIVPLTSRDRGYPAHVSVPVQSETGLNRVSFALCDQLQSISQDRLLWRRGVIDADTMREMEHAVRVVLGL